MTNLYTYRYVCLLLIILTLITVVFCKKSKAIEKYVNEYIFNENDEKHKLKSCENINCIEYPNNKFGTLIKENKKYLFIHIPKNAGTYIRKMFPGSNGSHDHVTAFDIRKNLPHVFQNCYKFAIIRDPYERCVSMYNNHINTDKMDIKGWGTYGMNILKKHNVESFEDFVELLYKNRNNIKRLGEIVWEKQTHFITDENGNIIVDKLIDIENLDKEVKILKKKFNITIPTPKNRINVSQTKDYMSYYSNQLIYDMVTNIYKDDVTLYNMYRIQN